MVSLRGCCLVTSSYRFVLLVASRLFRFGLLWSWFGGFVWGFFALGIVGNAIDVLLMAGNFRALGLRFSLQDARASCRIVFRFILLTFRFSFRFGVARAASSYHNFYMAEGRLF